MKASSARAHGPSRGGSARRAVFDRRPRGARQSRLRDRDRGPHRAPPRRPPRRLEPHGPDHVDYTVPDALAAAFLDPVGHGRLVVATPTALFIEAAEGLRRLPAPAELRALAVAGSRLWVATARGVFLVDGRTFVQTGVEAAAADHLFGLANGDLLLAAPAGLARLSIEHTSDHAFTEADSRWSAVVEPIVQRVCAKCHLPGGSAGIDLSTPAAWRAEHVELVHRVVETRTMPPAGTELGEADRRILAEWLLH